MEVFLTKQPRNAAASAVLSPHNVSDVLHPPLVTRWRELKTQGKRTGKSRLAGLTLRPAMYRKKVCQPEPTCLPNPLPFSKLRGYMKCLSHEGPRSVGGYLSVDFPLSYGQATGELVQLCWVLSHLRVLAGWLAPIVPHVRRAPLAPHRLGLRSGSYIELPHPPQPWPLSLGVTHIRVEAFTVTVPQAPPPVVSRVPYCASPSVLHSPLSPESASPESYESPTPESTSMSLAGPPTPAWDPRPGHPTL